MSHSRRDFLARITAATAAALPALAFAQSPPQQQDGRPLPPHVSPPPPNPAKMPHPDIDSITPDPHAVLQENQKNIRKDIQRLLDLAQELKKEIDKTDAAEILNLGMIHKAEEIEKLAHKIQSMARG